MRVTATDANALRVRRKRGEGGVLRMCARTLVEFLADLLDLKLRTAEGGGNQFEWARMRMPRSRTRSWKRMDMPSKQTRRTQPRLPRARRPRKLALSERFLKW